MRSFRLCVTLYVRLFYVLTHLAVAVQPKFDPRNVTVKKGADAKEFYDLLTEVGR